MSDEHMMLMSQGAIEALESQAYDNGYWKGREDQAFDSKLALAEFKKLEELLGATNKASLVEACEQLMMEVRAHREAGKAAAWALEKQRKKIDEQAGHIAMLEQSQLTMGFTLDQQHNEIRDLQEKLNSAVVKAIDAMEAMS